MLKLLLASLFLFPVCASSQRSLQMIDGPRGNKIGFFQFLPPGYLHAASQKHPLIIFLHGIGEKGTGKHPDIDRINCCGIPKYINAGNSMEFSWLGKTESFVVLYPQLASKYGTWQTYYVDELIKYAKTNLNIDSNRIFLTGLSLGGGGTWVYASASVHNAEKLAGIVPVVSPCFMTNGCNIANAHLPVLTIHVMDDKMANPMCTINAIKSINDCGAEPQPNLLMYETGSHFIWVSRAYDPGYRYWNPNIFEWMLAQSRTLKPNKKPVAIAGKDTTISVSPGVAVLDGSSSYDPDGKVVRYVWQKVSGPSSGFAFDEVSPRTTIRGLTLPGVYTFQIRVIDNRAEWSNATVRVIVTDNGVIN